MLGPVLLLLWSLTLSITDCLLILYRPVNHSSTQHYAVIKDMMEISIIPV